MPSFLLRRGSRVMLIKPRVCFESVHRSETARAFGLRNPRDARAAADIEIRTICKTAAGTVSRSHVRLHKGKHNRIRHTTATLSLDHFFFFSFILLASNRSYFLVTVLRRLTHDARVSTPLQTMYLCN